MSTASGSKKAIDGASLDKLLAKVSGSSDIDASLKKIRSDDWDLQSNRIGSESTERHGSPSLKDKRSKSSRSIRQAVKYVKLEDDAKTAKKKHQADLDLLVTKLEAVQKERDIAEEELERMKTICAQWEDKEAIFLASQDQLKTLREKLRVADSQALTTAEDLAASGSKIAALERSLNALQRQTEDLGQAHAEIAALRQIQKELQATIDSLNKREESAQSDTIACKKKLNELELDNDTLSSQVERLQATSVSDISTTNAIIEKLQHEVGSVETHAAKLQMELQECRAKNEKQSSELSTNEQLIRQNADELMQCRREATAKAIEMEDDRKKLTQQLEEAKVALSDAGAEVRLTLATKDTIHTEMTQLRQASEDAQTAANRNEKKMQEELNALRESLQMCETTLRERTGSSEALHEQNTALELRVQELLEKQSGLVLLHAEDNRVAQSKISRLAKRLKYMACRYTWLLSVLEKHETFQMAHEGLAAAESQKAVVRLSPEAEASVLKHLERDILADENKTRSLEQEARKEVMYKMREVILCEQQEALRHEVRQDLKNKELDNLRSDTKVMTDLKQDVLKDQETNLRAQATSELVAELKHTLSTDEKSQHAVKQEVVRQLIADETSQVFIEAKSDAQQLVTEREGQHMYNMARDALLHATIEELQVSDDVEDIRKSAHQLLLQQEVTKAENDGAVLARLRGDAVKEVERDLREKELDILREDLIKTMQDEVSRREGDYLLAEARKKVLAEKEEALKSNPQEMQVILDTARNRTQQKVAESIGTQLMEEAKQCLLTATIEELREDRGACDEVARKAYSIVEAELVDAAYRDESSLAAARTHAHDKLVHKLLEEETQHLRQDALIAAQEEVARREGAALCEEARAAVLQSTITEAHTNKELTSAAKEQAFNNLVREAQTSIRDTPQEIVAKKKAMDILVTEFMDSEANKGHARDAVLQQHVTYLREDPDSVAAMRQQAEEVVLREMMDDPFKQSVVNSLQLSARDTLVERKIKELEIDTEGLQQLKDRAASIVATKLETTEEVQHAASLVAIEELKVKLMADGIIRQQAISTLKQDTTLRDEARANVHQELLTSGESVRALVTQLQEDPVQWGAVKEKALQELCERARSDPALRKQAEEEVQKEIAERDGNILYQKAMQQLQESCVKEIEVDEEQMRSLRDKAVANKAQELAGANEVYEMAMQAALVEALKDDELHKKALALAQEQVAEREGEELCTEARAILLEATISELKNSNDPKLTEEAKDVLLSELVKDQVKVAELRQEVCDALKQKIMTDEVEELSEKVRLVIQQEVAERDGAELCNEARKSLIEEMRESIEQDEQHTNRLHEEARGDVKKEIMYTEWDTIRSDIIASVSADLLDAEATELREEARSSLVCAAMRDIEEDVDGMDAVREDAFQKLKQEVIQSEREAIVAEARECIKIELIEREGEQLSKQSHLLLLNELVAELKDDESIVEELHKQAENQLRDDIVSSKGDDIRVDLIERERERILKEEGVSLRKEIEAKLKKEMQSALTELELKEIHTAAVAEIKADLFAHRNEHIIAEATKEMQNEFRAREGPTVYDRARDSLAHTMLTDLKEDSTQLELLRSEVRQEIKDGLQEDVSEEMTNLSFATVEAAYNMMLETLVTEEEALRKECCNAYGLIVEVMNILASESKAEPFCADIPTPLGTPEQKLDTWNKAVTEREQAVFHRHAVLLELEKSVKGTDLVERVPPPLSPEPIMSNMSMAERERALERRERTVLRNWEILMQREASLLQCAQDALYTIPDGLDLSLPGSPSKESLGSPQVTESRNEDSFIPHLGDSVPTTGSTPTEATESTPTEARLPATRSVCTAPSPSSSSQAPESSELVKTPVGDLSEETRRIKEAIETREVVAAETGNAGRLEKVVREEDVDNVEKIEKLQIAENAAAQEPPLLRRLGPRKVRTSRHLPPKKRPDDEPLGSGASNLSLEDQIRLGLVVLSPQSRGVRQRNLSQPPSPQAKTTNVLQRRQSAPPEFLKHDFNLETQDVSLPSASCAGKLPSPTFGELTQSLQRQSGGLSRMPNAQPSQQTPPAIVSLEADFNWYTMCTDKEQMAIHESLVSEVAVAMAIPASCITVEYATQGSINFTMKLSPFENRTEEDLLAAFHAIKDIPLPATLQLIRDMQTTAQQEPKPVSPTMLESQPAHITVPAVALEPVLSMELEDTVGTNLESKNIVFVQIPQIDTTLEPIVVQEVESFTSEPPVEVVDAQPAGPVPTDVVTPEAILEPVVELSKPEFDDTANDLKSGDVMPLTMDLSVTQPSLTQVEESNLVPESAAEPIPEPSNVPQPEPVEVLLNGTEHSEPVLESSAPEPSNVPQPEPVEVLLSETESPLTCQRARQREVSPEVTESLEIAWPQNPPSENVLTEGPAKLDTAEESTPFKGEPCEEALQMEAHERTPPPKQMTPQPWMRPKSRSKSAPRAPPTGDEVRQYGQGDRFELQQLELDMADLLSSTERLLRNVTPKKPENPMRRCLRRQHSISPSRPKCTSPPWIPPPGRSNHNQPPPLPISPRRVVSRSRSRTPVRDSKGPKLP